MIALHRAGMTQVSYANHIGIDKATVWRWIHGRTVPPVAAMRVLASESQLPFEWLRPPTGVEGLTKYTPRDLNPEPTD